jgi:hypothetical protein
METAPMTVRSAFRLASVLLFLRFGSALAIAQEGLDDLARAREVFEKEIAFSTRPIRDRYLSRLDGLKRSFGSRGDARAAAAVQDEIDRVNAMSPEPAGVVRFAGVWRIQYDNGATRRYQISADGSVTWDENLGKAVTPPARGKVMLRNGDFLLDWGDGSIERLKISSKNLMIDHFAPMTTYPAGKPGVRGVGVIMTSH